MSLSARQECKAGPAPGQDAGARGPQGAGTPGLSSSGPVLDGNGSQVRQALLGHRPNGARASAPDTCERCRDRDTRAPPPVPNARRN